MLLKWSKRVFGKTIVNGIVRHTFFHQFCAGKALHTFPSRSSHHGSHQNLRVSRMSSSALSLHVRSLSEGLSPHYLCDGAAVLQVL